MTCATVVGERLEESSYACLGVKDAELVTELPCASSWDVAASLSCELCWVSKYSRTAEEVHLPLLAMVVSGTPACSKAEAPPRLKEWPENSAGSLPRADFASCLRRWTNCESAMGRELTCEARKKGCCGCCRCVGTAER